MAVKRQLKARKTPSSEHPATPPKINSSLEMFYYAVDQNELEKVTREYPDQIVTSQILYKPALLAIARITFEGSRWEIHHERDVVKVVPFPPYTHMAIWEEDLIEKWENANSRLAPEGISFYVFDKSYDFTPERFEGLQEEFIQHLISSEHLEIFYNPYLKMDRKITESEESFQIRCLEKAREEAQPELQKILETILRQEARLKERLDREVREAPTTNGTDVATLDNNQTEMNAHVALVTIDQIRKELEGLEAQKLDKLEEFDSDLERTAHAREKDIIRVNRSNVHVLRFALVWLPYTELIIEENEERRSQQIKCF
ncbi:MAG: hypothetical protein C5B54_04415 [Acidobacteria bacterium]|nr:MAG: hypothetical protein C5B54_04415 [Acidobacteriota bacterium]